jgi:HPr kinase/phosphorylase
MPEPMLIHSTAVAIDGKAVLLRGFSGAGKSDLGLRLIDAGAMLVADDQCELVREDETIIVRPPATIAGLLELRGIGIMRFDYLPEAPLALVVDLMPSNMIERYPTRRGEMVLGLSLPAISIAPFEASAPVKLRMALHALTGQGLPWLTEG